MIYFDHNATAPTLPESRQAWLQAAEQFPGNPSSPHRLGSRADAALSEARQKLASCLGCDALDIVWTSGATEACNMALHHFARARGSSDIWVSAIEHPAVLEAARHYFGKQVRLIPAARSGMVDVDWIGDKLAKSQPGAVVVMAANNETGVLQPWSDALELCRKYEIPFFCDATQWIGKLPGRGLGLCDFVCGSAHKFGGPKGVGFLKCPPRGRVEPLIFGGKQEEGRRAGTENVAGALAMAAALEIREEALAGRQDQTRLRWRDQFERQMLARLPGSIVVGAGQARLWNTVSALMPEADCQQRWVVKLDKAGFAVSTGSACASGQEKPSHVLSAMGYSAAETARVLRFSSGWETREEEWHALVEALGNVQKGASRKSTVAQNNQ